MSRVERILEINRIINEANVEPGKVISAMKSGIKLYEMSVSRGDYDKADKVYNDIINMVLKVSKGR